MRKYNYLIIGSGIIGLSIAREIRKNEPGASILLIDKENDTACHASGRNSGVLHAGFYYPADSLKARFTAAGNAAMKDYCLQKTLPVNACGKLVVAQDDRQAAQLEDLCGRGTANGVKVRLVSADAARDLEPNVKTHKLALYSPDTATIDPKQICLSLKKDLMQGGVGFSFQTTYLCRREQTVLTTQGEFLAGMIINCAGLHADTIARDFAFGHNYTIMPFKGVYLNYTKNTSDIRVNIYPAPDPRNPFLGVHFTKAVDGRIKIGPTAMPAFGRENYHGIENLHVEETPEILFWQGVLFLLNAFHFRDLTLEELKKHDRNSLIALAQKMVQHIDPEGFTEYACPGIRAQLIHKRTRALVQDFVVEGDSQSIHILNAVSPAYTCAFPFAKFVYDTYVRR